MISSCQMHQLLSLSSQPLSGRYIIVLFVVTDTGLLPSVFGGGLMTYTTAGAVSLLTVAVVVIVGLLCCYRRLRRRMTGCSAI